MKKTQTDVYETTNDTDGTNAFEYLAENTDVEWSQTKTGKTSNNKNYLSTSHDALVDRNIKIVLNIISNYSELTIHIFLLTRIIANYH